MDKGHCDFSKVAIPFQSARHLGVLARARARRAAIRAEGQEEWERREAETTERGFWKATGSDGQIRSAVERRGSGWRGIRIPSETERRRGGFGRRRGRTGRSGAWWRGEGLDGGGSGSRATCGDQNRDTAVGGDGPGVGGIGGDGFNHGGGGGGTVMDGEGSGVEEVEEGAEDALFEDGVVGGVGGCGEEGDSGGGLVADKGVGRGVEEADKGGEVPHCGDKQGELGGIGGKEPEEGGRTRRWRGGSGRRRGWTGRSGARWSGEGLDDGGSGSRAKLDDGEVTGEEDEIDAGGGGAGEREDTLLA